MFGEQTGTASVSLSFAAVELLQPATEAGHSAYAREERSVAGHIHMRLLDLVRECCLVFGQMEVVVKCPRAYQLPPRSRSSSYGSKVTTEAIDRAYFTQQRRECKEIMVLRVLASMCSPLDNWNQVIC